MTRRAYIEQIRRLIYNGQPSDDATISVNLVNAWLNQAVGIAAQKNYQDNYQLDGIAYTNGSFYTTFKSLAITKDEQFLFKINLPQIPIGLGHDEGINTVTLTDNIQNAYPIVLMNQSQKSISRGMRPIPNKLLGYSEGQNVYILSSIPLYSMTAKVTMVSAGDSTNLDSTLNIPDNYFPTMTDYLCSKLMFERSVPKDVTNDGEDFITTT